MSPRDFSMQPDRPSLGRRKEVDVRDITMSCSTGQTKRLAELDVLCCPRRFMYEDGIRWMMTSFFPRKSRRRGVEQRKTKDPDGGAELCAS